MANSHARQPSRTPARPSGPIGSRSPIGSQGPQGPKGPRGPRGPQGPTSRRSPKRKNPLWASILKWTGIVILSLAVLGSAGVAVAYSSIHIPDANADFKTETSFVYYADGETEIGSYRVQNRQSISFDQMSEYAKDAIVALENKTFWTDPGFSLPSMARAVVSALQGQDVTGASTITQQYIKVMYLTQEKTMTRKIKEIFLAAKIGQQWSKQQILEGYLNTVYFGRGAYGIAAASQAFFNKPQSELTMPEATALVCIINNPSQYDPGKSESHAAELLGRYQLALNNLVEMGSITAAEREESYSALPKFPKIPTSSRFGGPKGFLLKMVQDELESIGLTEDQISGGGLKITTTFDKTAQDAAVKAAQEVTLTAVGGDKKKAEKLHAALVSLDNETGGVLALYAGPDYVTDFRNWATTHRAPASTFKPYALVAGLRDGWTLEDTLTGNPFVESSKMVNNDDGHRYGRVTLLKATISSINTAFVDLTKQIPNGPQKVAQAALDAGVKENSTWDLISATGNRLPLGGQVEVSPLDQAAGYSTFANQGLRVTPHVVAMVEDSHGVVYQAQQRPEQAITMDVANDVTYALSKVAQDGTGRTAARLPYPVAGKTGTGGETDPKTGKATTISGWFVGFTKQITTSVMFVAGDGHDNLDTLIGRGFYGSGYPAQTWLSYMQVAMRDKEPIGFAPPTNRTSTRKPSADPKPTVTATPTPTPTWTATDEPGPEAPPTDTQPTTAPPTTAPPTTAPPTTAPPATAPPATKEPAAAAGTPRRDAVGG